jgi:uncharacterized coiled-coil DUF342 family protein
MKDTADCQTQDIFQDQKRLPGRPVTGKSKTNAERMREYRLRRKEQGVRVVLERPVDIETMLQCIDDENNLYREIEVLREERDQALKQVQQFRDHLNYLISSLDSSFSFADLLELRKILNQE